MNNFGIKGDELRHGKHIYLDAPSQASVDSFTDEPLSETMLYHLNGGSSPIAPTSARAIAQQIKASDGMIFALRLQSNHHCIGFAHIADISWQARHAILHVHLLDEASLTNDILSDAIQTVLQFIYWEANLNRIQMQCLQDDTLRRESLEQLGFTLEGHLRQEAYRDGHYLDIMLYSILARDWSR